MPGFKIMNRDLFSRFDTEDKKNYGLSIDYQITQAIIKTWEDRNTDNIGSKLNP